MWDMRLIQGDCLKVMQDLIDEGVKVDAVICDPPFGTISCRWDTVIPFDSMWEMIEQLRKERAAVVLFGKNPFSSLLVASNVKNFKYDWVFEKSKASGYPSVKNRPMSAHHDVMVFYPHHYYPQMEEGKPYKQPRKKQNYDNTMNEAFKVRAEGHVFKDNEGTRYPRSVKKFRNAYYDDGKQVHPTQKSVAEIEYLIRTYTNEGDTMLDFTSGSGTAGVAAVNTKRHAILIEQDPDYYQIGVDRVKKAQQQLTMF